MAAPISDLVFHVKRSAVDGKAPTMAGIDRGCSLTKALYLPKNDKEGSKTHYAFHIALFLNANFLDCLQFLKKNAKLPAKGIIRCTGTGSDKYREKIREILGLDVEFVHEHFTIIAGAYQFVKAVDDHAQLFYPKPKTKSYRLGHNEELTTMVEEIKKTACKNDGTDPIFPFIYVHVGSGVAYTQINGDGSSVYLGLAMGGGKTLMGLSRSIAGIDNYDELMKLALTGKAENVDTTAGEVLREDENSEYGSFSKDLPLFSLGKVVDENRAITSFDKKDRAASVVRLFAEMVFTPVSSITLAAGISKVIFGGHATRGEALRNQLVECGNLALDENVFNIRFLKTGGTGAFAAMTYSPTEESKDSK